MRDQIRSVWGIQTTVVRLWNRVVQSSVVRHVNATNRRRGYASLTLLLFLTSTGAAAVQPFLSVEPYVVDSAARGVLPKPNPKLAEALKYDVKTAAYKYNEGYTGADQNSQGTPRITANIASDPQKGIEVTDVTNELTFSMKPKFGLGQGRQESNQIMYPLTSQRGYLVYTAQISGVKEDILVANYTDDTLEFGYELVVPDGLETRLESNGSLAVYGSTLPIYGQVSTGTKADEALLMKAKQAAKKDKLLFTLPAPVVVESGKTVSQVKAQFELDGNELKVIAKNLQGASFPLSIDPSVYVETAQKLMRGNNETNVDFDVTNELIQKGELTGGRFNNWINTLTLPASRNQHATAGAGGYIYMVGGKAGNTRVSTVSWAQLNSTTRVIEAANPGTGACANWCTNAAYDLPVALSGHSMVAYNGFLYVLGGETSTGRSNAVYIAKLGMNGEPSLWFPGASDMDTNKSNWVYWYQAGNLNSERNYTAAAAYNNRMYLVGGQTNASTGGVTTVEKAEINPTGTLSTWSATGMVSLTSIRRSHNIQVYNDRMYIIGGISNVTPQSSVQYIRIANNGNLSGSWVTTKAMSVARFSDGGNFSTVMNGYLYVSGGCSNVIGGGNWCSVTGLSNARSIALTSINADGSITNWDTITGLDQPRTGYGLVSWRKALYGVGGCTAPNDTTGACNTDTTVVNYGAVNRDGDVSTTDNSVASGTAPCSGVAPTNCDIPPVGDNAGQGGRMASGVVMNNGYIYIIGGCTDVSTNEECNIGNNGQMSGNISRAAFAADGTLVRPTVCAGTFYGSWCVDSTNRLNGTLGLGALGATVFNNTIYAVSGTTGDRWNENIWRVGLNEDGSLTGAWTSQSFSSVGLGGIGRGFMFTFARANPNSAGTNPGNLYIIGGCNGGSERTDGIICSTYFGDVWKCNITTSGAIGGFSCSESGQLQLDSEPGGTQQGLSNMAGVVYANYIYLVGGASPNQSARGTVMYAKIDNNNNIVPVSGTTWTTSPNVISPARQRGAAFGYNGYLYSLAGYSGTGSLNDVLYAKIDVSDGSIGTWNLSFVTVTPRWQIGAIVANGFVYAFGGCGTGPAPAGCTALTGSIQTFQLYNNYSGTPAGYSAGNNIGVDRIGGSAVVQDGYIYYAGGCSVIACTTATNTVYYAPLNADGTIGTWASAANTLPAVRSWGKLLAQGGTLYYIGGQDSAGTAQSTIFYSTPSGGVPGVWNTATNGLPAPRTELSGSIWDGRLFMTGGHDGGTRQNSVYASPELFSGGDITSPWITTNGFNVARSGHATFVYSNNLYVVGGSDGTNYLSDVQFAKLDPATGAATNWTFSGSLPQRVYQADAYAANGYLYVFGGRSGTSSCTNNTYVTPISANTTIASGNNPTGIGDWSQTNVEFTEARYGAAVAYDQGKAYVLGGGCTAFVAAGNRTYVSTLQSQPATARYSRMIDTDTDVFPTKWLMNGLDNDVGARWTMRYRSSTATTAAWGQETSFGTVTLGQPENYVALDSGGANTNFARYYYMSTYIDSSKAFGYPDDVTRGPTINDISLFFTADPSKRLKHGKTFTQGQLQPLDTPF